MKFIFTFFVSLICSSIFAQNEFAATSFYADFNKIYADARMGFQEYKGAKKRSEYAELRDEFRSKLLLPLADSATIIFPKTGEPFVVFYFEPDKVRLKVDQKGANLRDAILTAFNKPLYAITETKTINNYPFSDSWYFDSMDKSSKNEALFRITIYYNLGKYYLTLEIRGKNAE